MIFFCTPYASMVCNEHKIQYFLNQNVLTFFSNYSFEIVRYWKNIITQDFTNYLTAFFIETEKNLEFLKENQCIKGTNSFVVGYSKMDQLKTSNTKNSRKKVLICPHHTVKPIGGLLLSNFLNYKDFFLELPKKYPEIDFIFRPHPLLFPNLLQYGFWTNEQVNLYLDQLLENENVTYSTDGDYLELFAQSDGMIHDCGSFLAEYLYTEKPCCYMLKNPFQIKKMFLPIGEDCLNQHYKAYCADDITQFINEVILQEKDPIKENRVKFSQTVLKKYYLNSSQLILDHVKSLLGLEP